MSEFFQNLAQNSFVWASDAANQLIAAYGFANIIYVLIGLIALIIIFRIIHAYNIK